MLIWRWVCVGVGIIGVRKSVGILVMKTKLAYLALSLLLLTLLLQCNKKGEEITGSVAEIEATPPQILANGISTATIIATISDSSGNPASGWTIEFTSTYGTITEKVLTDGNGRAYATLKSCTSEVDLPVTVTASIVDTSKSLRKQSSMPRLAMLEVSGTKNKSAALSGLNKSLADGNSTASIALQFLGIIINPELEANTLPADGISKTNLKITIKETTSKKAVSGAQISLAAAYGTIANAIATSNLGVAVTELVSYNHAVIDTIYIEYGDLISKTLFIAYESPVLKLTPSEALLLADGKSKKTFYASLISKQNAPIVNALINFSTSNGVVAPNTALTNSEGIAEIQLTSASALDSNVQVIARYNTLSDTVRAKFIQPTLTLSPLTAEMPADGLSQISFIASLHLPDNTPVVDTEISFSTSSGSITPAKAGTDAEGKATAQLRSGTSASADVVVTAAFQSLSATAHVVFSRPKLSMTPSEAKLPADGVSKQVFVVSLLSADNNPVANAEIQFVASKGSIFTSSNLTSGEGKVTAELRSGTEVDDNVLFIAKYNDLADTARVQFVTPTSTRGLSLQGGTQLYRDGFSSTQVVARVLDEDNNPVLDATVFFSATYGQITANALTNIHGEATATYLPDVGETDVTETITATIGTASSVHEIKLLGMLMQLSAIPDSIPADGNSTSQIMVHLKLSSQAAVPGVEIHFSSDRGAIGTTASTNEQGIAGLALQSDIEPGIATVTVQYGGFVKSAQVQFYQNAPQSINLQAEPNFIWVKETGNLEQTVITATVLGVQGLPIGHEVAVKFYLRNGPGGGEGFVVEGGNPSIESQPIKTVEGKAIIGFRAGTRSGTAEIKAELADLPGVAARTTNIVIRSGPPYIWVDPANANNVVTHMTATLDYFNLDGWGNIREYKVGILVGDKYNNPVERGTTVYLTSTAGIITTDVKTDDGGKGEAILTSANPLPYLEPMDGTALAPHRIPNPNNSSLMLPISVPNFEYSEVISSAGDIGENDGVAVIYASTHGRNQDGNDAVVYSTNMAIFSGPILRYDVTVIGAKDTLRLGETATVQIRIYDINGNPPAAGSTLKASTSAGKLSNENLMPDKSNYGFGSTIFSTTLLNNLDPTTDEATMAEVSVEFNGNSVRLSKSVYLYLRIN
jgi:hypothetical protein